MFEATILVIVISAFLVLYRMIKGPTIYDRILTANIIGTKTVVVIVLAGFVFKRAQFFVDIALVYVLINFILVLAFLKYVEKGRLD
ncbi:MAG TPA: cation:proton antiporter [Gelria sp.]|nr:cation:proton antiporter [Gelria sp.]